MIPILFKADEVNFNHNGLGLLSDVIYCEVEEEGNESYELELGYPVNSRLYNEIRGNCLVKAKANDRFEPQLFRIYYISKPLNGKIIVKAEHISYKLKDNFVESLNYTGNCQGALNALNNNAAFPTGFNFYSDINMSTNFIADKKNFWKSIKGESGSIVDTYGNGSDIVRNNFNISVMKEGGVNNNILISYKKNLSGIKCEEDWTGCITKIYPYAVKDDVTYILDEKYVNSQYLNRDPNPRIEAIDFSSEFESDEEITKDKLRILAKNYFINNKCDVPKLTYSVELIALSKTEECRSIANENIGIFDYLIIRHEVYNINTTVKVVKTKYDSIKERYLKLEVNFKKDNLSKTLNNTNKKIRETDKKIDNTKEELSEDIDEAKEEATRATNNLKVTFEARADSIELSVENVERETKASIEVLEGEIELKVDEGDFGTLIEQNSRHVTIAVHDETDMLVTFDSNGQTIEDGALTIKSDGETVFYFNNGTACVKDIFFMNGGNVDNFTQAISEINTMYVNDVVGDSAEFDSLDVWNNKNCIVGTKNYGIRRINAYETAEYYFGDLGYGIIKNGLCIVMMDEIFKECVNTNIDYHIFTQVYNGSIKRIEKHQEYFIVYGSENTEFSWEIKAKRIGYENVRLEEKGLVDEAQYKVNTSNISNINVINSNNIITTDLIAKNEKNDLLEVIGL